MAMEPKFLVLGSSGFVGTALMPYLQKDYEAKGMASSALDLTSNEAEDQLCDIVEDRTILVVLARARSLQNVFSAFDAELAIARTVAGCLSKRPIKKCLYFSTLSVYSDTVTNLLITEETAIAPSSLYGVAKYAGECLIKQAASLMQSPIVIVRPCKIYGPGDTPSSYGPVSFITSLLKQGNIRIFGDGSELRDLIFVQDVVEIITQLAIGNHQGVFNLATGKSYTFGDIVDHLREIVTKREFNVVYIERDRPKIDQELDVSKLLSTISNFQFTSLYDGLSETYTYYASQMR